MKVLASNKKAYFNFDILESVEAGIILNGWEVKSAKAGRINLSGAYIKIKNDALFLINANIAAYKFSASPISENEQLRERKLLLHRKQILALNTSLKQSGTTLVPLEIVQNNRGLVKVVVALVRGRKKYDKRAKLKEQDLKIRIDSDRKRYNI